MTAKRQQFIFIGGLIALVIVGIVAGIVIASATGDDDDSAAPASTTQTVATAPSSITNTPADLPFGQDAALRRDSAQWKVSALEINPEIQSVGAPPDGTRWSAALVRSCTTQGSQPVAARASDWVMLDGNGGRYPASSTGNSDFPVPKYPFGTEDVPGGECVQGWVVFPVAEGATIDRVRFAPGGQTLGTWKA